MTRFAIKGAHKYGCLKSLLKYFPSAKVGTTLNVTVVVSVCEEKGGRGGVQSSLFSSLILPMPLLIDLLLMCVCV